MRILLAAHGYPPELVGGTELAVQALARELDARGCEVCVVAGTLRRSSGEAEAIEGSDSADGARRPFRVVRIARPDLYFDHWHKGLSPQVGREFRRILGEARPDAVHVHHWLRLSRDLVWISAREGIPALVTLHDAWVSCPIAFRVRPLTRAACEAVVGPDPCVACAASAPPRTPWVPIEQGYLWLHERQQGLQRELELARAVTVPTAAHGQALERFLGRPPGSLGARVVPTPRRPLGGGVGNRGGGVGSRGGRAQARPRPGGRAEEGILHLGSWGTLAPHKGVDVILEAIAGSRLRERIALDLAGAEPDPAYAARLRRLSSGLRVRFHGAYAPRDLPSHPLAAVDAFVSGALAPESHGLTFDEARELSLPALLPRSPAFVERAGEGRGVLYYEPGDPRSLGAALERLAEEPGLLERLEREAAASAPAADHLEKSVEAFLQLYGEAIAAGPPAAAREEWFEERMRREAIAHWDAGLSARTLGELGLA